MYCHCSVRVWRCGASRGKKRPVRCTRFCFVEWNVQSIVQGFVLLIETSSSLYKVLFYWMKRPVRCTRFCFIEWNVQSVVQGFVLLNLIEPSQVAALSKDWFCGRSLAGITGSNPAGGMACVWCVLLGSGHCDGPDSSSRGVKHSLFIVHIWHHSLLHCPYMFGRHCVIFRELVVSNC
jgi:hypothetical protein